MGDKQQAFHEIHGSSGWNLLATYYAFRDFLFPRHTKRRLWAKLIRDVAKHPNTATRILYCYLQHTASPGNFGHLTAESYFDVLYATVNPQDQDYRVISNLSLPKNDVKLIAFYLPRFYPIAENDTWCNKDFTEWTNVRRALPRFKGHYQPRRPGELGFYDLSIPEVLKHQIKLAKQYGLYGFCFHVYGCEEKPRFGNPLEQLLADPELDMPFCINWKNDVLFEQNHAPKDDLAFIIYISKYLKDQRYIQIGSKPLLLLYRPSRLQDARATAQRWRTWCRENGIGEIFIALTHSFELQDPSSIGFDAAVEFAPNTFSLVDVTPMHRAITPEYQGAIYDYHSAIDLAKHYQAPSYKKFRGICPGWDNEARRPGRSKTLVHASPRAYKEWLKLLLAFTRRHFEPDERLIFINAWNAWAEGAYLEPDQRYGYAFLEATSEALLAESEKVAITNPVEVKRKHFDTAVILHLFYPEMWDEISRYLNNMDGMFDLYISAPQGVNIPEDKIRAGHNHTHIFRFVNRGRDISPFLNIMSGICSLDYTYVLKLHTKKSRHRLDGDFWRQDLFNKLAGSKELVNQIKGVFDSDPEVGIVAPKGHVLPSTYCWSQNETNVKLLAQMADFPYDGEVFDFVAGSMFWFRPSALNSILATNLTTRDFEPEQGQVDGTLAHALERFFGLLIKHHNMKIVEFNQNGLVRKGTFNRGHLCRRARG